MGVKPKVQRCAQCYRGATATRHLVAGTHGIFSCSDCIADFMRLAHQWRGWANTRFRFIGAALFVLFEAVVVTSLAARTPAQRPACLIPGLGTRDCNAAHANSENATDLVAPAPVSVVRHGATLTVTSLFSSRGVTTVALHMSRLPYTTGRGAGNVHIALRDAAGRSYSFLAGETGLGDHSLQAQWTFSALNPVTRLAIVVVTGPPAIGHWQVRVPVIPRQRPGLQRAPIRDRAL